MQHSIQELILQKYSLYSKIILIFLPIWYFKYCLNSCVYILFFVEQSWATVLKCKDLHARLTIVPTFFFFPWDWTRPEWTSSPGKTSYFGLAWGKTCGRWLSSHCAEVCHKWRGHTIAVAIPVPRTKIGKDGCSSFFAEPYAPHHFRANVMLTWILFFLTYHIVHTWCSYCQFPFVIAIATCCNYTDAIV